MATSYATSEYAGLIRYGHTRLASQDPLSTSRVRNCVVNNLLHTLDSRCQCNINITGRSAGKASWDGLASSSEYTRMIGMPPIPVVLHPLADGTSTRLVISIDAQISLAGTATWLFALTPRGSERSASPPPSSVGLTSVATLSTSSTSVVELGPVSVYVTPTDGSRWWSTLPTLDAAGNTVSTLQLMAQLEVWAFSSSTGVPRIHELNAREWVA
jgi:hypothetical protein